MKNALDLAKKIFGNGNIAKTEQFNIKYIKKYKITVFCPEMQTESIANAMAAEGAGLIGKYSDCSFRLRGTGTFRGGRDSNPYIGKKGKLEFADEIRLEMICDAGSLNNAVNSMLKVHPYEEPAYDIYEILNGIKQKNVYGVKIVLKKPVCIEYVFKKVSNRLDTSLIPERWKKIKIKNAAVDISGDSALENFINRGALKTLYITKNFKKTINIRLI